MKFIAICTSHKQSPVPMLDMLARQTRQPDEAWVGKTLDDGVHHNPDHRPSYETVYAFEERDDFGYSKRNEMVEWAKQEKADYVGFFCQDDNYDKRYLELMLAAAKEGWPDVVWCNWNEFPNCQFEPCHSTLGNFIITPECFLEHEGFAKPTAEELRSPARPGMRWAPKDNWGFADAMLINRLAADPGVQKKWVPKLLYYHNVPFSTSIVPTVWGKAQ